MKNIMKFLFGAVAFVGFFVMVGAAGNDCDGKCMENAVPLGELIMYMVGGLAMMFVGVVGVMALNEE